MANRAADMVRETANAPGTGTLTLGGAPTGYRSFAAAIGVANSCYVIIRDSSQFEVCDATLTTASTLTRDTVLRTSAGGTARINFTGAVDVYQCAPFERSLVLPVGVPGPLFLTAQGARLAQAPDGIVPADGAATLNRGLRISTAGVPRWEVLTDASAETGGNAGSNFALSRYSDAGAFLDVPLRVDRATAALSIGGVTPAAGYTLAGDLTLPAARNVRAKNTAKAWANFNGTGTVAIRDGFNVSSITDNGTGDYTLNFANAMVDANYAVFHGVFNRSTSVNTITQTVTKTTSSVRVQNYENSSLTDLGNIDVAVFGA
jgi:hypothetical protein